jgi:hypothetical protein
VDPAPALCPRAGEKSRAAAPAEHPPEPTASHNKGTRTVAQGWEVERWAGGWWPVAGGRWLVAGGWWPAAGGVRPAGSGMDELALAGGVWQAGHGRQTMASKLWQAGDGRRAMAGGLW